MGLIDFFEFKTNKKELYRYVGKRKRIVIPKWVEAIGVNAFYQSNALVVDTNKVSILRDSAFHNASKLQEVMLSGNIEKIPSHCFAGSFQLRRVNLPESIKEIKPFAFDRCKHLTHIKLPESLETLDNKAFKDSGIMGIIIPKNVRNLGEAVFEDCEHLKVATIECLLDVLPSSTFSGCENLEAVILPSTIKTIEDFSFFNCKSLIEVVNTNQVEEIGCKAFENSNIKKIDLSSVKTIGDSAFYECFNLEEIVLSDDLEVLKEDTFSNTSLEYIKLPSKLKQIDLDCFSYSKLKEVTIPGEVKSLGNRAFGYCSNLERITITNPETKIHRDAFIGCSNLKEIIYRGKKLNISNIELNCLDNETLEYLYENSDNLTKVRGPITLKILKNLEENNLLEDFFENAYYKNYRTIVNKFMEMYPDSDIKIKECLFILCYTLGVFKREISHKSCELIKEHIVTYPFIRENNISRLTSELKYSPINESMIKDICSIKGEFFKDILRASRRNPKFFSLCLTYYDEVQAHNNTDRAEHATLRPTVTKFKEYFDTEKFRNIETFEDAELAKIIGKFYNAQYIYDNAKKIVTMYRERKVIRSLISEKNRKEEFTAIEKVKGKIRGSIDRLDYSLTKVYYEFLNKDDGLNLIVGRYCNDCCGHIQGVGEDIAFASMLDPKTQTLIIRDAFDSIVSKAVFNINSDNEIIVNGIYVNHKDIKGKEYTIANKYVEAFKIFIEDYKEHHGVELKGVYVAVSSPMLEYFCSYGERMGHINVLDYSEYMLSKSYKGDARNGVICILDNREKALKI